MSVLAIYTNSFPYGKEEIFLESEITCLSLHFKEIIILPFQRKNGEMRSLPDNVRVLTPIQSKKWSRVKIYLTGLLGFYKILRIPEINSEIKNFSIFKCLKYIGFAILTKNRISKILPFKSSVHYSYWLNFSAFSLTLLKIDGKINTIISRAHGYDLYEDRGEKSLMFIKGATLKNLNKLYLISNHGLNYLSKRYPEFSDKFSLSRLGTSDPEFKNPTPDRSSLTIVSCSGINPNKRIYLILDSLIFFNSKFPFITVKWYHLGDGENIVKYVEKAKEFLHNSSVQCYFPGQMTNLEVFNFYKSVPVDLFINVSKSEGIPVSIMEAQSFGIPVIATAVGGTPEIVNNDNGFLFPVNPSPEDISTAMYDVFINKNEWELKRRISRRNWEETFNAEKNYNSFALELLSLV